jgi:DNA-binding transcriptional regulator YdaS (Cro superfamily)
LCGLVGELYKRGMHLDRWVRQEGYGALSRLARDTGLAYGTVYGAYRRRTQITYASAAAIQKATKGQVTVDELCSAKPLAPRRKRAA